MAESQRSALLESSEALECDAEKAKGQKRDQDIAIAQLAALRLKSTMCA